MGPALDSAYTVVFCDTASLLITVVVEAGRGEVWRGGSGGNLSVLYGYSAAILWLDDVP